MKKIRVYLDNCCFNRPYDDQEQITIRLESSAKLEIQAMIKNRDIELVWSFMLDYENNENIDIEKRSNIFEWEQFSDIYFIGTEKTSEISKNIEKIGLKSKDAVHLACAIETECNYFITTDKGIYKKREYIKEIRIINPMEFFIEAGENYEK